MHGTIIQMFNLIYAHLAESTTDETTMQKELLLTDDRVILMCYLYVEGSRAGDHLEQVVPHHVLAGGHKGDGFSDLPLNQPKHRADREAD